jgi:hypothetical protein
MQVNPTNFGDYLSRARFDNCGDKYERPFGHYLAGTFPNCERFWRVFVVPMTKRILEYPDALDCEEIRPRQSVAEVLEDIAAAHYSMFFNLVVAHLHLEERHLYSHESIYVHLGSACDLAARVLTLWYLTRLECRGQESGVFQKLAEEEFVRKATEAYRDYEDPTDYYLKRRRTQPLRLTCSENDLLHEYVSDSLQAPELWREYVTVRDRVKTYRNVVVHDVRMGRHEILGRYLVPKLSQITNYRTWRQVAAVADKPGIVEAHFRESYDQATESVALLEATLDEVWDKLIADFVDEFYCRDGIELRKRFDMRFSDEPKLSLAVKHFVETLAEAPGPSEVVQGHEPVSASGIHTGGGSATWSSASPEFREPGPGAADPAIGWKGLEIEPSSRETDESG